MPASAGFSFVSKNGFQDDPNQLFLVPQIYLHFGILFCFTVRVLGLGPLASSQKYMYRRSYSCHHPYQLGTLVNASHGGAKEEHCCSEQNHLFLSFNSESYHPTRNNFLYQENPIAIHHAQNTTEPFPHNSYYKISYQSSRLT